MTDWKISGKMSSPPLNLPKGMTTQKLHVTLDLSLWKSHSTTTGIPVEDEVMEGRIFKPSGLVGSSTCL